MSNQIEFVTYILSNIDGFNNLVQGKPNSPKTLKLNNIIVKDFSTNNYKMVNYDKTLLSVHLISTYGLCRSVIFNSENKVVCFAPPKSTHTDSFITKYSLDDVSVVAEEFVEGTMINVFWDKTIGDNGGWEIATRNSVSANYAFYQYSAKHTFRSMFQEACKENNLVLENLNKNYCYSFVLQHPKNRIVVPFKKPNLYLVAVYSFEHDEYNDCDYFDKIIVHSVVLDKIEASNLQYFGLENANIQFPKKYTDCKNYTELIEKYASMNTPYNVVGVVIYNRNTGERTKIRNPAYEQVRQLRGNQPKLQYQYLYLRNQGKIADFLKYFPENKPNFSEFRDQVHLFTNTLFSNYISCYIKKEKPLIEYPEQYRTHMFNLHRKYLNDLKEKKQFITNTVVKQFVNELHPSLLMYSLNYPLRKRCVDSLKCEDIQP